jgi:hypothetical protein
MSRSAGSVDLSTTVGVRVRLEPASVCSGPCARLDLAARVPGVAADRRPPLTAVVRKTP